VEPLPPQADPNGASILHFVADQRS
jgi:hypothetical protein